jgi:hypothetical protein
MSGRAPNLLRDSGKLDLPASTIPVHLLGQIVLKYMSE